MKKENKNSNSIKHSVYASSFYPSSNLNKWDYVMAITQEQINYGLRNLFNQGALPTHFEAKGKFFFQDCELTGDFGQPMVEAMEYGLKLCKLTLPISDATLNIGGNVSTVPDGTSIVIKTSLTSIQLSVHDTVQDYEKYKGVYINFLDENAVYDVQIDGMSSAEVAVIESMLKQYLKSLSAKTYLLTVFQVTDEEYEYVPKLVRFTFNYDSVNPELSPFIVCSSISGKEPNVDNPLVFDSKILPEGVSACIWLSQQLLLGHVITQSLNANLGGSAGSNYFNYDGNASVTLGHTIYDIDTDESRQVNLTQLNFNAEEHSYRIYNEIEIPNISFMNITGVGEGWSKISLNLSKNKTTVEATSEIIKTTSGTVGTSGFLEWVGKIVIAILTLGLSLVIESIVRAVITGKVGHGNTQGLITMLNKTITSFNKTAGMIPALQDSIVKGHLLFEDVTIENNGSICLGILGTESKKNMKIRQEEVLKTLDAIVLSKEDLELPSQVEDLLILDKPMK